MDFKEMVERKYLDAIGKHFFSKGVSAFVANEIPSAFENFQEGLKIVTCDCSRGNWQWPIEECKFDAQPEISSDEFSFCKAFLLSYEEGMKTNEEAIDSINQYLKSKPGDDLAWYIKGKILTHLKRYEESFECLDESLRLQACSRTLYRIGRLKEEHLGIDGIEELFHAFMGNQSSPCCGRVLQKYSFLRGIKIEGDTIGNGNGLIQGFNNYSDPWSFQTDFEDLLKSRKEYNWYKSTAAEMILSDFVSHLLSNKFKFCVIQENEGEDWDVQDDELYDYEDDYSDWEEDYFDAMTDGQLGSYDDFLEKGGDLDFIDDWAGR
jgi:tetratricopeptide (TPR) repeat protein